MFVCSLLYSIFLFLWVMFSYAFEFPSNFYCSYIYSIIFIIYCIVDVFLSAWSFVVLLHKSRVNVLNSSLSGILLECLECRVSLLYSEWSGLLSTALWFLIWQFNPSFLVLCVPDLTESHPVHSSVKFAKASDLIADSGVHFM